MWYPAPSQILSPTFHIISASPTLLVMSSLASIRVDIRGGDDDDGDDDDDDDVKAKESGKKGRKPVREMV